MTHYWDNTMKTLLETFESYNLSTAAICDLTEAVNSMGKYINLPQATKDSMQAICDLFDVILCFNQKGKRSKLFISGIIKPNLKSTYLYPDGKINEHQKLLKNSTEFHLLPFANNVLTNVEV